MLIYYEFKENCHRLIVQFWQINTAVTITVCTVLSLVAESKAFWITYYIRQIIFQSNYNGYRTSRNAVRCPQQEVTG